MSSWDGPIHRAFGLSYASYLVLPRTVLQEMPEEWQQQFVDMINEMHARFSTRWEPEGGYTVQVRNSKGQFVQDRFSNYRYPVKLTLSSAAKKGK